MQISRQTLLLYHTKSRPTQTCGRKNNSLFLAAIFNIYQGNIEEDRLGNEGVEVLVEDK